MTGFDAVSEVKTAIIKEEIYSIQELSYYCAKGLRMFLRTMNIFAPYREQHPIIVCNLFVEDMTLFPFTLSFSFYCLVPHFILHNEPSSHLDRLGCKRTLFRLLHT